LLLTELDGVEFCEGKPIDFELCSPLGMNLKDILHRQLRNYCTDATSSGW